MLEVDIPGFKTLNLSHLVLDYNGTLAEDGCVLLNVREALIALSEYFQIHVVTADTFGEARKKLSALPVKLTLLPLGDQAAAKRDVVESLGAEKVVAIGNGRNDRQMLELAAVGIAIIQAEGAATQAVMSADVVSTHILDALKLLQKPKRLIATLRS